jgi:predicted glycoside hydrolase/deacetylase ChbG (UPF0249 family)
VRRSLVVNADDFGRTAGINRGVARAHEQGIVTSASLMVRYPAAAEAADYARSHRELGVGLHVDLGEWQYGDGGWHAVYELEPTADEVQRQLEQFRRLVGEDPTHIDSHQHVHREEPAASVCRDLARRLAVPVRHFGSSRYLGAFYGQTEDGSALHENVSVDGLVGLIESLPEGVTELCCHPGEPEGLASAYLYERKLELETLCHPRVQAAIDEQGVELCSFRDVPPA